jgi:hypothetical protein
MGQQQLLLIILGVIIVGISIAVGLSLFAANSIQANKDAMINDINNIGANAYQHYIRPASMAGGQQSYDGSGSATARAYTVPFRMSSNDNATYAVVAGAQTITITGTSTANAGCTVAATVDNTGAVGAWTFVGDAFQ